MSKMHAEEVRLGGYQVLTLMQLSVNLVVVAMSHALTIFYKYTPRFYCQESGEPAAAADAELEDLGRNRTYGCVPGGCPGQYLFEPRRAQERSVAMEWQLVCEREGLLRASVDAYYAGMLVGALVAGVLADRLGRLPVMAICLYAQGTMAVALNVIQDLKVFLVFRGLQGVFAQGLESCTFILCLELFPARFRSLVALAILSMRSFGLALLAGLSYAILDWRILQLVVSVPTALTVLYIWMIPESPRWLLAKGKLVEAEMLLERIGKYNRLCGPPTRAQPEKQRPRKPRRKTAPDLQPACDEIRSPEESADLLPAPKEDPPTNAGGAEVAEAKGDRLPAELNIEEIAKASLLIVTETTATDSKGSPRPSYLLVSREALATAHEEPRVASGDGTWQRTRLRRFFRSKFIGRTCFVNMCMWFASSMAFHALVSLPQRLSTDRHVSLALAACMEVSSFVLGYFVVTSRCGRRRPLCATQILVGTACLALATLSLAYPQPTTVHWIGRVKTIIVMIGRAINIASFFILRLIVIELFPTITRGTGVGLCIAAEMIGGLIMPYISLLNSYVLELPRFLIGSLCICTGLLTLIFPETSWIILPDSVEEAKNLGQKDPEVLREKLFSEDWVDAGNGIIVNFTDKNPE